MAVRIAFDEPLPLSLAVIPAGRLAFIAGQVAPPGTPATTGEQTLGALGCLEDALRQIGADRSHVVRCLCFLADIANWEEFNAAYSQFFTEDHPTRTTVGVELQPGLLVEIEAIAELPSDAPLTSG
jgi:2-iminobutanoate/2-iminopropanoate deaminase